MEKKTPLYDWHETHGGKIVPFAGFLLPVHYETGIVAEHCAVREGAGIFDVSHMGEFILSGHGALKTLQRLFTNDFLNMPTGRVRYTLMCNDEGGIIDDLVVCKMDEDRYFLVVNAANCEKDSEWISGHIEEKDETVFEDVSGRYAQIALQGPSSVSILSKICDTIPEKYYTLIENGKIDSIESRKGLASIECIVSRTGYTGETGFEIFCKPEDAVSLWEKLLEAGKEFNLVPVGLGARDTLRLEASMPLYGHEMDETINPFEAGLSFAVKMNKEDFIGKQSLIGKEKPERVRTGLKVTGRGIIREHCEVFHQGLKIGDTTSGTFCPFLKQAMAMALLSAEYAVPGTKVEADVRGRLIEAEVCELPFYKRI